MTFVFPPASRSFPSIVPMVVEAAVPVVIDIVRGEAELRRLRADHQRFMERSAWDEASRHARCARIQTLIERVPMSEAQKDRFFNLILEIMAAPLGSTSPQPDAPQGPIIDISPSPSCEGERA